MIRRIARWLSMKNTVKTMDLPHSLSVVVPTKGRLDLVERLLVSLQRATTVSKVMVETIIVDDSPPSERDKIKSLCRQYNARYIQGSSSVREKRNRGIEESVGNIILFVDSDCEVSANVFEEHLKMYNVPNTGGVLGITDFIGKENVTWNVVKRTKFLDAFSFARTLGQVLDSAPWGTCTNLSFRKKALEDIGKFDTAFPFKLGGDDVELGVRMNKTGYNIRMNPDAVVFHTKETWSNLWTVAKRAFRWGRMDYYVFHKKHKDKLHFTFPKPATIFLILCLAALVKIIVTHSFLYLLQPVSWLFLFLLVNSLLKVATSKYDALKDIVFEIPAEMLQLLFSFGTIIESLRNRSPSTFYREVMDDPRQAIFIWNEKVHEMWAILIALLFGFTFYLI